MMLEENISEKSGFVRLALGAGITALGIAHLARNDANRTLGSLLVTAGALKVAEGIFLYCPMKAMVNSNVRDALTTSFEEFMDGDSIMQAFHDHYNSNENGQSQNQSNSNSDQDQAIRSVANAAAQAAKSMGTTESIVGAATQAAKALSQNGQSNNKSSQQKQNQQQYRNNQNKNISVVQPS